MPPMADCCRKDEQGSPENSFMVLVVLTTVEKTCARTPPSHTPPLGDSAAARDTTLRNPDGVTPAHVSQQKGLYTMANAPSTHHLPPRLPAVPAHQPHTSLKRVLDVVDFHLRARDSEDALLLEAWKRITL